MFSSTIKSEDERGIRGGSGEIALAPQCNNLTKFVHSNKEYFTAVDD
jgi:hypothetical protein